jgi:2-polyprenyl-3-methyl-5-hydroxy-6-metoxy-1,4-benzoquinol methylase
VHAVRLLGENRVEVVAVVTEALVQTRDAFDSVAATYHASNAANPVLCEMRRLTIDALTSRIPPGGALLDLGCGPGTDAETLARAGYRITAIDWSPAMVQEARSRIASSGLHTSVDVHQIGIHEVDRVPHPLHVFDGAYSNLGAFNCVPDLDACSHAIARRLRPGGILVASVIGRICPWEIALFTVRRDWRRLRVRFARDLTPVPLNGRTVWTHYYTPKEFERAFTGAGFVRVAQRALGLFVPPPYMDRFAARHPRLVETLRRADRTMGNCVGLRSWGDHFLIVLRRT